MPMTPQEEEDFKYRTQGRESNFINRRNETGSNARGLYQFIKTTFYEAITRDVSRFPWAKDDSGKLRSPDDLFKLVDSKDKVIAKQVDEVFKSHTENMTGKLNREGLPVNQVNLGLLHRFGNGGGTRVIKTAARTPNLLSANFFSKAVLAVSPDLNGTLGDVIKSYQKTYGEGASSPRPPGMAGARPDRAYSRELASTASRGRDLGYDSADAGQRLGTNTANNLGDATVGTQDMIDATKNVRHRQSERQELLTAQHNYAQADLGSAGANLGRSFQLALFGNPVDASVKRSEKSVANAEADFNFLKKASDDIVKSTGITDPNAIERIRLNAQRAAEKAYSDGLVSASNAQHRENTDRVNITNAEVQATDRAKKANQNLARVQLFREDNPAISDGKTDAEVEVLMARDVEQKLKTSADDEASYKRGALAFKNRELTQASRKLELTRLQNLSPTQLAKIYTDNPDKYNALMEVTSLEAFTASVAGADTGKKLLPKQPNAVLNDTVTVVKSMEKEEAIAALDVMITSSDEDLLTAIAANANVDVSQLGGVADQARVAKTARNVLIKVAKDIESPLPAPVKALLPTITNKLSGVNGAQTAAILESFEGRGVAVPDTVEALTTDVASSIALKESPDTSIVQLLSSTSRISKQAGVERAITQGTNTWLKKLLPSAVEGSQKRQQKVRDKKGRSFIDGNDPSSTDALQLEGFVSKVPELAELVIPEGANANDLVDAIIALPSLEAGEDSSLAFPLSDFGIDTRVSKPVLIQKFFLDYQEQFNNSPISVSGLEARKLKELWIKDVQGAFRNVVTPNIGGFTLDFSDPKQTDLNHSINPLTTKGSEAYYLFRK